MKLEPLILKKIDHNCNPGYYSNAVTFMPTRLLEYVQYGSKKLSISNELHNEVSRTDNYI